MEVVGSCRTGSHAMFRVQPTGCRTMPSNKVIRRLLRKERERRRQAEDRAVQLEAALQMAQGENTRNVELSGEPPRPFCPENDYLFCHKSNYHNRGHQAFHELIRPCAASYTSIASRNEKHAMRLSLLRKFVASGGRFYQWNREIESAVEVDMDEALYLSGKMFSASLRASGESEPRVTRKVAKTDKHRGRVVSRKHSAPSLTQNSTTSRAPGKRPHRALHDKGPDDPLGNPSTAKVAQGRNLNMHRPYNEDRDYLFSNTGGRGHQGRGHKAFVRLVLSYRVPYTSSTSRKEKKAVRHDLLRRFKKNGGRFYQWDRDVQVASEVDLEKALTLSVCVLRRVYYMVE
jgi:hypothetical protein